MVIILLRGLFWTELSNERHHSRFNIKISQGVLNLSIAFGADTLRMEMDAKKTVLVENTDGILILKVVANYGKMVTKPKL